MKVFWLVGLMMMIAGCSENATTKTTVDSTVHKVDSTAKAVWDSTKEKAKDIKESLDSAFKKQDSAH